MSRNYLPSSRRVVIPVDALSVGSIGSLKYIFESICDRDYDTAMYVLMCHLCSRIYGHTSGSAVGDSYVTVARDSSMDKLFDILMNRKGQYIDKEGNRILIMSNVTAVERPTALYSRAVIYNCTDVSESTIAKRALLDLLYDCGMLYRRNVSIRGVVGETLASSYIELYH